MYTKIKIFSGLVLAFSIMACSTGSSQEATATLDFSQVKTYGKALADQVAAGDGAGIDEIFRNSGVVIDLKANAYYAVNGVHPVKRGDLTSYYPKSIVKASLTDDSIIRAYSFTGHNGHEVDMEAMCFVDNKPGKLYVGDEYNYIYELDLNSGEVTREWNLADIGVSTRADKGIEAMAYDPQTGHFYIGIQATKSIIVADLSLDEGEKITRINEFKVASSPSGLYSHSDGSLYMVTMQGSSGQKVFQYSVAGELQCTLQIPKSAGMTRPDGIFIDEVNDFLYLVDSQGPLYDGHSLYRIPWTAPCGK